MALEHSHADPVAVKVLAPNAHGAVVARAGEHVGTKAPGARIDPSGNVGTPGYGLDVAVVLVQHGHGFPVVVGLARTYVLPDPHGLVARAGGEVEP